MDKLNSIIETLSNAFDDPEDFREAFDSAIARRVQQHRVAEEAARERIIENTRVYLLGGNHIRLRRSEEIWTAEHFDLDVSAQGNSVEKALKAIFDASVKYVASLWKLEREKLSADEQYHYDFVTAYGGPKAWDGRFRVALFAKCDQLAQSVTPETEGQKPVPTGVVYHLKSLFQQFKSSLVPPETVLQAKTFDVDGLRAFYNEKFILLNLAQVHVTIVPDNDQIILHFMDDTDLNGLDITIYRLSYGSQKDGAGGSITRKIQGKDVRFSLSALGLTIENLDQVAFRVKIGNRYVSGRL